MRYKAAVFASLLMLIACGSAPKELKSEPIEPTIDLTTVENPVPEPTLAGLLQAGPVAFPSVMKGLEIGQPEAESRATMDRIRHTKLNMPREQRIDDVTVVGAVLADFESVGLTLLIQDGRLLEVDLSLPADEALGAVASAFGEPSGTVSSSADDKQQVWSSPHLQATLIEAGDKSILKFAAPTQAGRAHE